MARPPRIPVRPTPARPVRSAATPDTAARLKQGLALHQQGQWAQAQTLYEAVLAQQPSHFDAQHLLGVLALQMKDPERAVARISQALTLNPNSAAACSNLGLALHELQRYDEALARFDQALALQPNYAEAHNNRGNALKALQRLDEALTSYERALSLKPDYAEAHYNAGIACKERQQFEAAIAHYNRAIALRPGYADAYNNRGNALRECQRPEAALASFDQAIALRPDLAEAYNNRGNTLRGLGRFEAALDSFDRAIALKPDYAEAHSNRGIVFYEQGQLTSALASYDAAIALQPQAVDAHWNQAVTRLLQGDFARGWPLYEWRWKLPSFRTQRRDFAAPLWLGQTPVEGQTLLLHAEQGLGDTLQFCRYVQQVSARGARVLLEVQAPLVGLLEGLAGVCELIRQGAPLPAFDSHCPLLSLPLAFNTRLNTIPAEVPYLRSNAAQRQVWSERLQMMMGAQRRPRVGLVWSGSTGHTNDRQRSLPLAELLAHLPPQLDYVSLQKEVRAADQAALANSPIHHFGVELRDFTDTAALCDLLDLVVSVDTSVAHLSGAMGRPTWVLLPHVPDWRWLLNREDSPWYPSARLFRQTADRQWTPVLQRLGTALAHLAATPATPAAPIA